ncbi:cytochrome c oxidase subunit VB-domain-containing protein [Phycomyces blakesleeanus]|uniref:Cytochrome c oxidase subunit VB-domain-containing protein n=2 Tax=Phycomyces blakesleeanus TaxID=4837 RepID=A0ABR3AQH4_PHYBL
MFALRSAAIRAAPLAARPAVRPFSILGARLSGAVGHANPSSVTPGGKAGEVPTDLEQATGLERIELLAKLEGKELFDMEPLQVTHLGTPKNPIVVESHDPIRFVGCTGFPVESHDVIWINLDKSHEHDRCPECGSVFTMNFVGSEDEHHH